jgi:hypothetical protein
VTVDERRRHDLYVVLESKLGTDRADTLMSMLPPVGWADVATMHGVEREAALLRADLESQINQLRLEMRVEQSKLRADVEAGLRSTMRVLFFAMAGMQLTTISVLLVALG